MKVIIIEDESAASKRLENLLNEADSDIKIVEKLQSVRDSIEWFNNNPAPDLIFSDIQLTDGISFEIFKKINCTSPIIFTTAYDEYAIDAFKVNGIDYLLKPIKSLELKDSIAKFKRLYETNYFAEKSLDIKYFLDNIRNTEKNYKQRFLIKSGNSYHHIQAEDIAYFHLDNSLVFIATKCNKKYLCELTLNSLEEVLDPKLFFRINRQYIVNVTSIQKISEFINSRLIIELLPSVQEQVIVSRERVSFFKEWMDK